MASHVLASLPTTDTSISGLHLCLHIYKFPTTADILICFLFSTQKEDIVVRVEVESLLDTEPKHSRNKNNQELGIRTQEHAPSPLPTTVCVNTCAFMCISVHAYVGWRPEINIGCLPQLYSNRTFH